jgi:hypothetical protein
MSPVLREWIGKHSRFCVTFKGGYIKPQHHLTHGLLLIKPEQVIVHWPNFGHSASSADRPVLGIGCRPV